MKSNRLFLVGLFVIFSASLISLGYTIERSQFSILITFISVAFLSYFLITNSALERKEINALVVGSIILRLALVFCMPILSDDFYRYIWDGTSTLNGLNPYLHKPVDTNLIPELLPRLNSPDFYTVYPPFCQVVFLISSYLGGGDLLNNVIYLKLFILCFEIGTIFMLKDLLRINKNKESTILLYALNPLIITEFFCGLHFEAAMIFFVVASIWLLSKSDRPQMLFYSSLCLAMAICTKLWPVLILPLFIRRIGWSRTFVLGGLTSFFVLLMFIPFWDESLLPNFFESLKLYFTYFEFNASFFTIFKYSNYHWAWFLLPALKIILLLSLGGVYLFFDKSERNIFETLMLLFAVYFIFSSTIHPWYITPLLAFSLFTRWRAPYIWSYLICFTYITYISSSYQENSVIVFVEYLILFGFLAREIFYLKVYKID